MKKLAFLLAAAFALVVVLGASADPSNPNAPQRDNGRGHWFKHACGMTGGGHRTACGVQVVTNSGGTPLVSSTPPASSMTPAEFQTAYSLPQGGGSGQTIAVVDAYDDPTAESDLATFSNQFGLPACTTANGCFRKVNEFGGTSYPAADSGWSLEIALDIETAHGICPSCKILLVEASSAQFSDLSTAENEAVTLGASVVSNSWGAPEFSGETAYDSAFNHPGVPITASSGDGGYGTEYPAASPYVTAVGGTTLTTGANGSYVSESAWPEGGSGCSHYEPKPSWQKDSGCAGRTVVDVAADADPNTGAAVYVSSYSTPGWYQVGGTSLASPLIASLYALSGTASQVVYGSTPYAHSGSLHDITSGWNGSCSVSYLCKAGPGYDGPTGLGTPNGLGAFTVGQAPPPQPDFTVSATPSSSTVTQGADATYTVTVGSVNGFSSAVSLGVSSGGLPSGATAVFGSNPLTPGSTSLTIHTTSTTTTGTSTLTITGSYNGTSHSTTVSLTIQAPVTPDFTISATPSSSTVTAGTNAVYTIKTASLGGFSSSIALSVGGLPANGAATLSPASVNPGGSSTLTVSTAGVGTGTSTLTITGKNGTLTHSTTVSLTVQQQQANADFTISVSPSSATISRSGSSNYTVTITRTGGFSSSVQLSAAGLPRGMSASFSPNPVTGTTSTLTIGASILPLHSSWTISINGSGGGKFHSTTLKLSTS